MFQNITAADNLQNGINIFSVDGIADGYAKILKSIMIGRSKNNTEIYSNSSCGI